MKNFMVANHNESSKRYNWAALKRLLKAQIENSLDLGWRANDVILIANFDFEYLKVKSLNVALNEFCLTGSKLFGLKWYFDNYKVKDMIWAHDLDCWQNVWFDPPEFEGDIGASQYSNPKYNGGSIFWKPEAKDILGLVVELITSKEAAKEEPLLNKVFKSKKYRDRISVLNYTYNVGCSGFRPRYRRSIKPIKVCHFHPKNSIAWELHALDRAGIGEIAITPRLEKLLRQNFKGLANKLKKEILRNNENG